MSKMIDENWDTRAWCIPHNEKYINGECPYDILVDFMEQIEELGAETDGSKVDMNRLDGIYQRAIARFREVVPPTRKDRL